MTRYMLDTDMCSYIIKERPVSVLQHFHELDMENICISIVSYAELMYGVQRSKRINHSVIKDFTRHLDVIKWDIGAADEYAVLRTDLEAQGTPTSIGAMDMMIAAHSKSINTVLVTNNQKHFTKVKGLIIENWI